MNKDVYEVRERQGKITGDYYFVVLKNGESIASFSARDFGGKHAAHTAASKFAFGGEPEKEKSESSPVNHPPHYNSHPSGIECIEVVRHMSFNLGNAVKYLWRAGHKGPTIEDLEKARWYIEDEIQRLKDNPDAL